MALSPRPDRRIAVAPAPLPAGLVTLAAGALVIAGLVLARPLLVPLVLAVLLGFVLAPVMRALQRLYLPRAAAGLLAVLLGLAVILLVLFLVSQQLAQLAANLPAYQRSIAAKLENLHLNELIEQASGLVRGIGSGIAGGVQPGVPELSAPPTPAPAPVAGESAFETVRSVAEPLLEPIATAGIVVVFTIFALLYRTDLRDRLIRLAGARDLHRTVFALNDAAERLSRFFLTQIALNAGFGVAVALALWVLGLPNPPLWGVLAALMRFVPFIGTFIAVIPPVLLAMAVEPGWGLTISVAVVFLVGEGVMGQVAEPLLYGRSTGLSPVSVLLAATFWAFLWGPIGLLLATPLTVCLVVLGRHVERFAFLEIMLGDRPPLAPEESFYQAALAGDADALVAQAKRRMKEESLAAWEDGVAMPGLALAQADWSREVLDTERQETIRHAVETLLDELAEATEAAEAASVSSDWAAPGAVLCVAGRGPFDDLSAALAAAALRRCGYGATAVGNAALDGANLERMEPGRVRLCVLAVLEEGNSAAGVRFFLRRLRRRLPEARVAIGLWAAPADSAMMGALRSAAAEAGSGGEPLVTSVGELLALTAALAAPGAEAATIPAPGGLEAA